MRNATASILLLFTLLLGCATTNPHASKTLLDFLEDGMTTKEEVVLKLGQPSGTYEAEKIVTFRIGKDDLGYFVRDRSSGMDWVNTSHSLVLVFDENNILRRHSLVPVK